MSSAYHKALELCRYTPASPLQKVEWAPATRAGVCFYIKRDDLLHPHISGNKWRKLLPQLAWHLRGGASGFATVGGRHSNHLAAVAALCEQLGVPSLGYVRGEVGERLTPTEAFTKTCGMRLEDATRQQVRDWRQAKPTDNTLEGLTWLPEGGTSKLGLLGMAECAREVRVQLGGDPDAVVVAAGSGGTAAGIARATNSQVHAYAVVGDAGLSARVERLLASTLGANDRIQWHDASLGGFASGEPELWQLMQNFQRGYEIPLDPIYTAKALLHLQKLLLLGRFKRGSSVVFVHTGGLQGREAWMQRWDCG